VRIAVTFYSASVASAIQRADGWHGESLGKTTGRSSKGERGNVYSSSV